MKISLKRLDDAFQFEATNEDGRTVHMDAAENIGGKNQGVRPMQMLLMAAAGCAAIDIISILKKQRQEISDFEMDVDGERETPSIKGEAAVFKEVNFTSKFPIEPNSKTYVVQQADSSYYLIKNYYFGI